MQLSNVTQELLEDLVSTARAIDPNLGEQMSRLVPVSASVVSVRLLDLVTALSAELSRVLPSGRVEVRLASADAPELVYIETEPATVVPASDDSEPARLTLRLPQGLKEQAERASEAAGVSLNAWVVTQLSEAVGRHARHAGRHLSGFGKA